MDDTCVSCQRYNSPHSSPAICCLCYQRLAPFYCIRCIVKNFDRLNEIICLACETNLDSFANEPQHLLLTQIKEEIALHSIARRRIANRNLPPSKRPVRDPRKKEKPTSRF